MYINDITEIGLESEILIFADDIYINDITEIGLESEILIFADY